MSDTATHAIVSGRVQGVWFRASTQRQARKLGVRGWVRNLPDGTVELHAEGDAEAVEGLLRWAHGGPPTARVDRVEASDAAVEGFEGFVVR
jgi:acylphosphatase